MESAATPNPDEGVYTEPDPANPHGIGEIKPADRVGVYPYAGFIPMNRHMLRPASRGRGRKRGLSGFFDLDHTGHSFWNSTEVYEEPDQANPHGIPRPDDK